MNGLRRRASSWVPLLGALCLPVLGSPMLADIASTVPATAPAAAERISEVQALVLGVVEGLTEYLPVSSTGHLILASHAMGLGRPGEPSAVEAFEIVIQLGAILAVVGLYRARVGQMLAGLVGRSAQGLRLVGLLAVAFVPAAVVGLLLHEPIKERLFGPAAVAAALAVGGVAMIAVEWLLRYRRGEAAGTAIDTMTFRQAVVIGLVQCLALWPGTSRSMVTILAALAVGLDRMAAAEFSFLLALPTLGAATLYEGITSRAELAASAGAGGLIIGLVVSGIVAAVAVRGFVKWHTRHGLMPFGVYRILVAAVVYAVFVAGR
ncbi:MAG: undecaprenyl-diphosphate phosphatase [Phycisphaerae bacterium]|nr:undecaprenyl-diphosphate phosphatase [Phycisphaerae bacterium]